MKRKTALAICILCGTAFNAGANNLKIGAGVGVSSEIYKGYDSRVFPWPIIRAEWGDFYIHDTSLGYKLYNDNQHTLSVGVYYYGLKFKPSKSDYLYMKVLDKRKDTMMADLRYAYHANWGGSFYAGFSIDALDRHNSVLVDVGYQHQLNPTDRWKLTPGIGVLWANKKHNDYYFGVSRAESARSGLAEYHADDSWSYYVDVKNQFAMSSNWSASLVARVTMFDSEIKDSPMVSKKYNATVMTGVTYSF